MRLLPADSAEGRLPRFEIGLLWLTVVATLAALFWPKLDESFASPDNLMRLVQVRGLLDGAPWFDPHEPRFAPPLGYDTHWSRLIDAGVGGMILLFRTIVSPDLAERLCGCCHCVAPWRRRRRPRRTAGSADDPSVASDIPPR